MTKITSICRARMTVITGRPGSGKTTLAYALSRVIRCPTICRDEIKEGLVHSLPIAETQSDAVQRHANDVFFKTIALLLEHGVTLVAEAAFQHKLWAPRLQPLVQTAEVRIIVCGVEAELARSRHIERGLADPRRERFHGDAAVQAAREGRALPIIPYDPPRLDVPTLSVDTTDGYRPELAEIISFTMGTIER